MSGLRYGSLFSGYGGLDMGVQAVLGGTTAWVSDVDKGANKILAHRYPDIPNLGDITTVDWSHVEPRRLSRLRRGCCRRRPRVGSRAHRADRSFSDRPRHRPVEGKP